MIKSMQL